MKYVLDTNIVSYCLKGRFDIEKKIESALEHNDVLILSPITFYEIMRGLYAVKALRQMAAFERLCLQFEQQEMVRVDWLEAAKLYGKLENIGHPMSESDLFQAAFCIRNGYTLVTHNIKHFNHLTDLLFEDWIYE
jgi:tRNA(fMet)-specific endonuclease VapC